MEKPRRIGVILAAGRGRRMGGTKQLRLWPGAAGPKPLVCAAFDSIQPICEAMVVVLGHESENVATALADRAFHRTSSNADGPMFDSIRAGLVAAHSVNSEATIVLQPGDHPEVSTSTLRILTDCSRERPFQAILPEYAGQGGHPVLIPHNVAAIILETDCPDGLAQFWLDHPKMCRRVAVDDGSVLKDIDTPANLPPH